MITLAIRQHGPDACDFWDGLTVWASVGPSEDGAPAPYRAEVREPWSARRERAYHPTLKEACAWVVCWLDAISDATIGLAEAISPDLCRIVYAPVERRTIVLIEEDFRPLSHLVTFVLAEGRHVLQPGVTLKRALHLMVEAKKTSSM